MTLGIWLDRPGDDLRAHYEGRRNPTWWPSANAIEVLIDFMNATGSSAYDARIATLYVLQKDRPKRTARVVAELKRRKQWSEADEKKLRQREQEAASRKPDPHGYYTDFQNEYLDDSGWWAVTWLKMMSARVTRNIQRRDHSTRTWRKLAARQRRRRPWCEDATTAPNAITNNLF